MFCDGCGTEVQSGQSFCSRCGKQIIGNIPPAQLFSRRVQEHVRLLGILWLAIGALSALGGVVLIIVANTIFVSGSGVHGPQFLHPLLSVIGILILGKSATAFITGWGLLQHESWARVLAIVMAFISLFNVPFGTAVGVYTLWVLLPGESEREYSSLVAQRFVSA